MLKLPRSGAAMILLSIGLVAGIGCSNDNSAKVGRESELASTPVAPQVKPTSPAKPSLPPAQPNYYDLALDKAYGAASISQSAQSSDDWNLVISQWNEAIALMKAVPAESSNKAIATAKIGEYQRNLTYAQQQATRPIQAEPKRVVVVLPRQRQTAPVRIATNPPPELEVTPEQNQVVQPSEEVFQVPIKRRISGTPIILVTFNRTQQFEMIVDTGASGTVVTQQAAAALAIVPVAKANANTASQRSVEFQIGYVDSMAAGGLVLENVAVAIAPSPELEIGLLGHDFFGDYDVTIKSDVIEFRPR